MAYEKPDLPNALKLRTRLNEDCNARLPSVHSACSMFRQSELSKAM